MKTFITILLGVALVIFALSFMQPKEDKRLLSEEEALYFLEREEVLPFRCLIEGDQDIYSSCLVSVNDEVDGVLVEVLYQGLFDDSIRDMKVSTLLYPQENGQWLIGDSTESYRCHQGRGQQEFDTIFCS